MGPKYSKQQILDAALQLASQGGISQLTFGRLAKHMGINDRMVVYYFPNKEVLLAEVMAAMGLQLQTTLADALSAPAEGHLDLVRLAWPVLTTEDADRVFALFFEAAGLAAAGREPYAEVVAAMVEMWIEWTATFLEGTPAVARREAEAALALIDGLLLLRQLGGEKAASDAANALGIE